MEDHYFSVLDSLRRGEHALAQKSLETSLTLIRKRQKLIKLADGLLSKNMSKIISQTTRKMKKESRKRRIKPAESQSRLV